MFSWISKRVSSPRPFLEAEGIFLLYLLHHHYENWLRLLEVNLIMLSEGPYDWVPHDLSALNLHQFINHSSTFSSGSLPSPPLMAPLIEHLCSVKPQLRVGACLSLLHEACMSSLTYASKKKLLIFQCVQLFTYLGKIVPSMLLRNWKPTLPSPPLVNFHFPF